MKGTKTLDCHDEVIIFLALITVEQTEWRHYLICTPTQYTLKNKEHSVLQNKMHLFLEHVQINAHTLVFL